MKRPKSTLPTNALLAALRSISAITKSDGSALETHVVLSNGWVTASNGIIAIGEKVEHDLLCAPHAEMLINALSKCKDTISITQLDTKLSITSGPFRAQVPFIPIENLQRPSPDQICGPLDNRLRVSFEAVAQVPEKEETPLTASVLISGGSVFATDRTVIMESYHGCHLPVLSIPKAFAKLIAKGKKDITGFGFSNNSFTLWMGDSWIKTQLWLAEWGTIPDAVKSGANPLPVPEGLWDALSAVEDFSVDGWAYSRNGKLHSHNTDDAGSSYECYGLPPNIIVSIDQLSAVKDWAKKIDFFARTQAGMNCIKVVGDTTRCVIAGRRE